MVDSGDRGASGLRLKKIKGGFLAFHSRECNDHMMPKLLSSDGPPFRSQPQLVASSLAKVLLLRLIECCVVQPTGLPAAGLRTSIPHMSPSAAGPVDSSSGSSVGLLPLKFSKRSWNCGCATLFKVFLLLRKCPNSDSVRRD